MTGFLFLFFLAAKRSKIHFQTYLIHPNLLFLRPAQQYAPSTIV